MEFYCYSPSETFVVLTADQFVGKRLRGRWELSCSDFGVNNLNWLVIGSVLSKKWRSTTKVFLAGQVRAPGNEVSRSVGYENSCVVPWSCSLGDNKWTNKKCRPSVQPVS